MTQLSGNLDAFRAITLDDLNSVELMNRHDTKYIFHVDTIPTVFGYLYSDYEILEINNKRSFEYRNIYYDTDDYYFYHQHHNQRVNRYKVRFRHYVDSQKCYFEIKSTTNKDKTVKKRIRLKERDDVMVLSDEVRDFARRHIVHTDSSIVDRIKPLLGIDYSRITLVNRIKKERLTFDINLTYTDRNSGVHRLNNLVIAELKQESFTTDSPFIQCFRNMKIFQTSFSKYCMGIVLTEKNVRANRFKKKLISLQKLM